MTAPQTPPAGLAMAQQVRRGSRAMAALPAPVATPIFTGVADEFRKAGRTLPFEPLPVPCGAPTVKGSPCKLPAPCLFHGGQPDDAGEVTAWWLLAIVASLGLWFVTFLLVRWAVGLS